jgi:fructokinase
VGTPSVEVVDTIGAGDSFHAALLFALREQGCIERTALRVAGAAELRRALSFASQCAALTCTRAGADPPHRNEVTEL